MITITLPWPDSRLNPNRKNGKAWMSVKTVKDAARDGAFVAARNGVPQCFKLDVDKDVPLSIVFHAPDFRARDLDNLLAACKPALDGVARALGIDDSKFHPLTLSRGQKVAGGQIVVVLG